MKFADSSACFSVVSIAVREAAPLTLLSVSQGVRLVVVSVEHMQALPSIVHARERLIRRHEAQE